MVSEIQDVAVVCSGIHELAAAAGIWPSCLQPEPQVAYVEFNGVHDSVRTATGAGIAPGTRITRFTFTSVVEIQRNPVVGRQVCVCGVVLHGLCWVIAHTALQLMQDE